VLHRNEFSGALTGLTRVRRFQQDDAHIFCRPDQLREEVGAALEFMDSVYGVFGFKFELDLSTKPKKALGSAALWERAEIMMREALEGFGRPWKLNPGDGAFYGPKIDIKVFDALGRRHQCATIQLDFQLPIRFNLRYKARTAADAAAEAEKEEEEVGAPDGAGEAQPAGAKAAADTVAGAGGGGGGDGSGSGGKGGKKGGDKKGGSGGGSSGGGGEAPAAHAVGAAHGAAHGASPFQALVERARSGVDDLPDGFERPVIIHRAILGSVERFIAVLTEHTAGKWPFWLSPRQVAIIPVALKYADYAKRVAAPLIEEGYFVDTDLSTNTLNNNNLVSPVVHLVAPPHPPHPPPPPPFPHTPNLPTHRSYLF
jgi:threonyl-tRNA synthetase